MRFYYIPSKVKKQADDIRKALLERFSGQDRLNEMSFDEKRQLLHWLFDGKDHDGVEYGIYISKRGKRQNTKIDYYLYGRIIGLRTIKGYEINYQQWDEDETENNYKTKILDYH